MLLTKSWLMGVRRGWLSLLHPTIAAGGIGFDDVFRALGRMLQFVQNLRFQVLNERPAYSPDDPKLAKAFSILIDHIEESGRRAQHWSDYYEGKTPHGYSAQDSADGEKMLNLYRTNFVGALEGGKTVKKTGLNRMVPITAYMDAILKQLYAQVKDYEQNYSSKIPPDWRSNPYEEPVYREFAMGRMKVVVVDPAHNGSEIKRYVRYLEAAHKDPIRKGFGSLWYGTLFLVSSQYAKLNATDQAAYARSGYKDLEETAGTYHSGADIVKITAPANDSLVHTIVHEMGHRMWFRRMSPGQRARFESLLEGDWSMVHALLINRDLLTMSEAVTFESFLRALESGQDLNVANKELVEKKFKQLGLRAGVMPVSNYARNNVREAFAEVFEKYVMERTLTRDQVESFRSVIGPLRANQTRGRLSRRPAPQRRNGRH